MSMISKSDISQISINFTECDSSFGIAVFSQNSFVALTQHVFVICALVRLGILTLEDGTGRLSRNVVN
jgi:hypothetical protein